MSKSLGEKLHDAARTVWTFRKEWDDDCEDSRAEHEAVALAFCSALSHDETATATIEALTSERDSLLAALKPFANLYDARGATHFDEDFRPVKVDRPDDQHAWGFNTADITWGDLRRAAALTTTEG